MSEEKMHHALTRLKASRLALEHGDDLMTVQDGINALDTLATEARQSEIEWRRTAYNEQGKVYALTQELAALEARVRELEAERDSAVEAVARARTYADEFAGQADDAIAVAERWQARAEQAEAAFSVAPIVEIDNSGDEVRLIVEGSWLDNAVTGVRVGALHGKRVALVVIEDTPPTNTSPAIE